MQVVKPSFNEAWQYIQEMDLLNIINKITKPSPNIARVWSIEQAKKAVMQYKNYLYLLKKYEDTEYNRLFPSIEIDEIWHHHILDTRGYFKDCKAIFGEYLHHSPYLKMESIEDTESLQNAFNITLELYKKEFGEYIYRIFDY